MRIRPFGVAIVLINLWLLYNFLSGANEFTSKASLGFAFFFYLIFMTFVNLILYVIYRVTQGGKRRKCPACDTVVKKGLTLCGKCGFDFKKAHNQ
jgi:hypothetical protein